MSEGFKVGDVVRLKSGGPLMTVTSAADHERGEDMIQCVWCVWFFVRESGLWDGPFEQSFTEDSVEGRDAV